MTVRAAVWIAGAALAAAPGLTSADALGATTDWLSTDTYAGINLSVSTSSDASAARLSSGLTTATTVNSVRVDESGTAWRLFFGKRLHPNFAVEVGFADLARIDVDVDAETDDTAAYLRQLSRLTPSAPAGMVFDGVGEWRFSPRAYLLGRAGLFVWRADVSYRDGTTRYRHKDDGIDLHFGVGGGYDFTDQVGMRLEWERYSAATDMDMVSLGVVVRF